ncbi:hypothetical protein GmHk_13G036147 [Glycine max]|nr:hypothetical protein GmHk_13G036147 [Glycine max]
MSSGQSTKAYPPPSSAPAQPPIGYPTKESPQYPQKSVVETKSKVVLHCVAAVSWMHVDP